MDVYSANMSVLQAFEEAFKEAYRNCTPDGDSDRKIQKVFKGGMKNLKIYCQKLEAMTK